MTIDAASVDTGVEDRDNHLRTGDFLKVDEYPTITFASTRVVEKDPGVYDVAGDLTIKGVTKPVTLNMTFGGVMTDPWGNPKAIFSAETTIDREDRGLTWNAPLEAGGWLVGKEIKIEIEVQAGKSA